MRHLPLYAQILLAIVLALVMGLLVGDREVAGISLVSIYAFIGTLFLNALKMLIVPLITASIICGVAGIGSGPAVGRLGLKTLGFYALSSLLAILVGLLLVNWSSPGLSSGVPVGEQLNLQVDGGALASVLAQVGDRDGGDLMAVFLRMIPDNVVAAAAQGQMLGLITFSLLFGFFMTRLPAGQFSVLDQFWQGVLGVMMSITHWVMRFAPLGVFGLVAKTVAVTGLAAFMPLLWFFLTVVLGLLIHAGVILPLMLYFSGVSPTAHLRAFSPALLTAFSTASSSATLPLSLDCVEQRSGVSRQTSSFVLPLGATINMDGTALYECVAALFIAQAYGLELTFVQQFTVVVVALLTSVGVAGIPAASLVAISVILGVIGLPLEGIGLLLVTDRVLDMLRTAVNIWSDSCGAVVIARSEGERTAVAR